MNQYLKYFITIFLFFFSIQLIYNIFELFYNIDKYNIVSFWIREIILFIGLGYSLILIKDANNIKKKIQINNRWGFLLTIIFFIGLFSISDILGIERYGRYGTVKPDFDKGISTLSVVFLFILFYIYFIEFIGKKESSYFLICPKCEETYLKDDMGNKDLCLQCETKLVELEGFFEKNQNSKKNFTKNIKPKEKISIKSKYLAYISKKKQNKSIQSEEWWEID